MALLRALASLDWAGGLHENNHILRVDAVHVGILRWVRMQLRFHSRHIHGCGEGRNERGSRRRAGGCHEPCPGAYFPPPMCSGRKCDGGCCLGDACVPVPSYETDIVPILHARCTPCHFDGGIEDFDGGFELSTYTSVDNADIFIQSLVDDCRMPPVDGIPKLGVKPAPPLSATQRATLLNWLVCGAPNN